MRKSFFFAALSLGGLLAMADFASAGTVRFQGTRDQVRAACKGPDRELIEGSHGTACIDSAKDTTVLCYDDGSCFGSCPNCRTGVQRGPNRQLLDGILSNSIGVAPRGGVGGAVGPAR